MFSGEDSITHVSSSHKMPLNRQWLRSITHKSIVGGQRLSGVFSNILGLLLSALPADEVPKMQFQLEIISDCDGI